MGATVEALKDPVAMKKATKGSVLMSWELVREGSKEWVEEKDTEEDRVVNEENEAWVEVPEEGKEEKEEVGLEDRAVVVTLDFRNRTRKREAITWSKRNVRQGCNCSKEGGAGVVEGGATGAPEALEALLLLLLLLLLLSSPIGSVGKCTFVLDMRKH